MTDNKPATEINWPLLEDLASKLCDVDHQQSELAVVHHLLDITGIPSGDGDFGRADVRVYQLVARENALGITLSRVAGAHSRETGPAGSVGDYCVECHAKWPCWTMRVILGDE